MANRAFAPLLERQVGIIVKYYKYSFLMLNPINLCCFFLFFLFIKAQAEKIRSVQGMLQRFRTLFNLPSAIRGNINKGEYELAVREYRKAKSIVLPSHVH